MLSYQSGDKITIPQHVCFMQQDCSLPEVSLASLQGENSQPDGGVQETSLSEDSIPPLPPPFQLVTSPTPLRSHLTLKPNQLPHSSSIMQERSVRSPQPTPKLRQLPSTTPPVLPSFEVSNSHELAFICFPSLADSFPPLLPLLNSCSPQDLNTTVSSFTIKLNSYRNCHHCDNGLVLYLKFIGLW